jgi:hypothetical protein
VSSSIKKEKIMKKGKKFYALFLLTALCSFLVGCGMQAPTPTILEDGATKEAVLAYTDTKTDGVLAGMSAHDYSIFSKDFDEDMLKAIPQAEFDSFLQDRNDKVGAYISRKLNRVLQQGDFFAVIYDAKFEKEEIVIMRVVFRIAEPHKISGLWFDK